ncbi:MAG: XisH family protein [Deltaproteobacteria bacterium]|nr:XisH family protein [Deltaproteobacteria bacterium]
MPARDAYHHCVRAALVKDGWVITHDPLRLRLQGGRRNLYIDLGAERLLAAERGSQRIAVEIKTFGGPSDVRDFETAVGQFVVYARLLRRYQPDRELYLAVPDFAWRGIFAEEIGQVLLEDALVRVVAFDPELEEIVQWKPSMPGATR